jgi:hypothetical protein
MKTLIIPFMLLCILNACVIHPTDKKNDFISYQNKDAGWSIVYPNGWKVLNDDDILKMEGNAKKALESTLKDSVQMRHKNLIWLQKDGFNSFSSTLQVYDSLIDGPYTATQQALFENMLETYSKQGLQFQYKTSNELIDNLSFKAYFIKFLSADKKNVILYQIIFDRLIAGKNSITLSINFNNDTDKRTLINIVNSSKFKFRN